jgi:zinc protease
MKTVLLRDSSPLVSFRLVFRAGSAFDPPRKPGVAWLTAAMHASAGSRTRSYKEILDAFFPMAGSVTCLVDKEMTSFFAETHVDNLQAFQAIFREMLLDPGWRDEDFARVKDDAINYLAVNLRGQNDEELAKEVLYQEIYAHHPYQFHSAGTVSSLSNITIDDCREFRKRYYTEDNLWLGLSGRAEPDFAGLPGGTAPPAIPPAPPVESTSVLIVEKPARSVAISLGHPIEVRRGHPDYAALNLAVSCLGQHRMSSGRLFTRMRQLRGLNYGDYAYIEAFPGGMFTLEPLPNLARTQQIFELWIRPVEREQAVFSLRLALYELYRLIRDGLTMEEFHRTRQFLSKYVNLLLKTKSAELGYKIDSLYYGIPSYAEYLRAGLAALTLDQVNDAVRRHLRTDRLKIAMVGEDGEALRKQLLSGAPTPISYASPKPADLLVEDRIVERWPLAINDVRVISAEDVFR